MDQVAAWLGQPNARLIPVLMTVSLLVGASVVILLLRQLLNKWFRRVEPLLRLPYETLHTIARVVTGAFWLITAMLVLEIWGISVSGLWTLLVSAAAVIGVGFLATWTMVSNITASFFIAVWRPFRFGDTVEVLPENLKGQVIDRNLMYVVMREDGGAVIQIPNNLFFQKMFRVTGSDDKSPTEAIVPK